MLHSKLLLSATIIAMLVSGCTEKSKEVAMNNSTSHVETAIEDSSRDLSQDFKDYWYAGEAELTSYDLKQVRYGEIRTGTAVTIFVTEDFLPDMQVKADRYSKKNIPVLKLNSTKKFLTGIYPYSIMTSSFVPVNKQQHALKVTHSMQEWCGHVYVQLNNRKDYEIEAHSYFEGEADRELSLKKVWLEDEIWNRIRINPEELPTGTIEIIPSFEFTRMGHTDIESHKAEASIVDQSEGLSGYRLVYPELNRSLVISYKKEFPHEIEGWSEIRTIGEDSIQATTASKKKRMMSPYWTKNKNKDVVLRDSLGLK